MTKTYQIVFDDIKLESNVAHEAHYHQVNRQNDQHKEKSDQET